MRDAAARGSECGRFCALKLVLLVKYYLETALRTDLNTALLVHVGARSAPLEKIAVFQGVFRKKGWLDPRFLSSILEKGWLAQEAVF